MKEIILSIILLFSITNTLSAGVLLPSECKDEYKFATVESDYMQEFLKSINNRKFSNLQFIAREKLSSKIQYDIIFVETTCKDVCYKELECKENIDSKYCCE